MPSMAAVEFDIAQIKAGMFELEGVDYIEFSVQKHSKPEEISGH